MTDSAKRKVDWAAKHIKELAEFLQKERPFAYVVETNIRTGERATYSKREEASIAEMALICGDVVHNLRSALDHAYWEIVSPIAGTPAAARAIQFPYSETKARLVENVKTRLAHKVSPAFYQHMLDLEPHGEPGGNDVIRLLHVSDVVDKHRVLIPTADFRNLSSDNIKRQVPDFPINMSNVIVGMTYRDVTWKTNPAFLNTKDIGNRVPGAKRMYEKKLDVPFEIFLKVGDSLEFKPMMSTLHQLVDGTWLIIEGMRLCAKTP